MEKDPAARYQTAEAMAQALSSAGTHPKTPSEVFHAIEADLSNLAETARVLEQQIASLKTRVARASAPPPAPPQKGKRSTGSVQKLEAGPFVRIPPGEFTMGTQYGAWRSFWANAGDERPAHHVRIRKAFEIGVYPVTQAQWEFMMGFNPSGDRGTKRPVESVSWNGAQEYLLRLNALGDGYTYRLPTEAEWEYAARAGSVADPEASRDNAWLVGNSDDITHDVGQKQPNAWGLYDMLGNVWEWCQDWYDASYYRSSPVDDPPGPSNGITRVIRGGCFRDFAARPAKRNCFSPGLRLMSGGFRSVRQPRD